MTIPSQDTPMFSVIIPVHNKRPHVERSIQSVLNQTFSEFELLLVDDASTDGSLEEIKKFKDPRIRVFHRETPGPAGSGARNLGIANARAEWLAFLDADDEWMPDHLERMSGLANRHPECNFLSCGWRIYTIYGTERHDAFWLRHKNQDSLVLSFEQYLKSCVARRQPVNSDVACLRRTKDSNQIFPPIPRGEDLKAWLIYLARGNTLAWSNHIGAVYYTDSVNMVSRNTAGTPLLAAMITRIEEPGIRLTSHEKKLLKRFQNYKIYDIWRQARLDAALSIKDRNRQFNLFTHLQWRYGFIQCLRLSIVQLMPLLLIKLFRKVIKKWKSLQSDKLKRSK